MSRSDRTFELDSFDRKILNILQRDNQTAQRAIGKEINLSAAAVQRRIKRMQQEGIIIGNIAVVSPEKIGRPITLLVEVQVESDRLTLVDAIQKTFSAAPEVQQCYAVTGEVDFILLISVSDMAEYNALTRRLFFEDNNVKKFRTFVVTDRVKMSMAIPA